MSYSPALLDEIRAQHRISDHVGAHIKLKSHTKGEMVGLCPFHTEKTPSFTVNDAKKFYHCFGCGAHGDVIRWYIEYQRMTFPEAVEHLKDAPLPKARATKKPENGNGRTVHWEKTLPRFAEAVYDYEDAGGKLVFRVARIPKEHTKTKERKAFWTYTPAKKKGVQGWAAVQRMSEGRPLYRLADIPTATAVHVFEGEKCVDRFRDAFPDRVATTCCGGSQAWKRTDWTPLHSKDVLLIADENDAGRQMMLGLADILDGKARSLEIALPEGETGNDIVEQLDAGGVDQAIEYIVRWAKPFERPPPPYKGPVPLTMEQKFARGDYERPWLVEALLPADGFGLISAQPKVGKSTFARCLALSVARGDKFLNRATRQGPVLIVNLEDSDTTIVKHLKGIGGHTGDQIMWLGGEALDPDPGRRVGELEAAIVQYRPALTIIDPIFRFIPIMDATDYSEVGKALAPILDLARRRDTCILIAHHNRKSGGEYGTQVLGSTAIVATVDTLISLRRDGKARTIETVQREGDDMDETILKLDPDGWPSLGGSRVDETRKDNQEAILHVLEGRREPMTAAALREATNRNNNAVRDAINVLVRDFGVKQAGTGKRGDPFTYEHPGAAYYRRQADAEAQPAGPDDIDIPIT